MNYVALKGRLTNDPKFNNEGTTPFTRFSVAVNRRGKDAGADFINCVAFNKSAEFITNYFKKGSEILIDGRIQTGAYTNKDNQKVYTTDVIVNNVEFCGSKGSNDSQPVETKNDSFVDVPDTMMEELPFC